MVIKTLIKSIAYNTARSLGSLLNQLSDKLWILLHNEASISDTIIISGAPRSGTTWLMENVGTLPKYRF